MSSEAQAATDRQDQERIPAGSFRGYVSAVVASEGVARAAQFGVLALAARHLTAASFGIYGLAVAMNQLAVAVVQGGPELHATRLVAQQQGGGAFVLRVIGVKGGLAAAAYLIVLLAARLLYQDQSVVLQAAVQGLVLPLLAIGSAWVLKATGHFRAFAFCRSSQSLLFLAGVALLLSFTTSPLAVPAAELTATATVALFSLPHCLRRVPWNRAEPACPMPMLWPSLALGFSGLCSEAIWSMPVTMGGLFLDAGALGRVAGVNRVLTALNSLFQVVVQVFYPSLARRYGQHPENGRKLAGTLLVYAVTGSALLVAGGILLAGPLVEMLLGPGKATTVPVFRLCLVTLAPAFVGSIAGYCLLATGHLRSYTHIAGAALVLAAAILAVGYAVMPAAQTAAIQAVVMALYAAMQFHVVVRRRLLTGADISWSVLRPSHFGQLLSQR